MTDSLYRGTELSLHQTKRMLMFFDEPTTNDTN